MSHTPYSNRNERYTRQAHETAQAFLYPQILGVDRELLSFNYVHGQDWDTQHAIDCFVEVDCEMKQPIQFSVQERHLRPRSSDDHEVTVTEWNSDSNTPSELYKIKADYFLFSYYNAQGGYFLDAVWVNVPILKRAIALGYKGFRGMNSRSHQSYRKYDFDVLAALGALEWRLLPGRLSPYSGALEHTVRTVVYNCGGDWDL